MIVEVKEEEQLLWFRLVWWLRTPTSLQRHWIVEMFVQLHLLFSHLEQQLVWKCLLQQLSFEVGQWMYVLAHNFSLLFPCNFWSVASELPIHRSLNCHFEMIALNIASLKKHFRMKLPRGWLLQPNPVSLLHWCHLWLQTCLELQPLELEVNSNPLWLVQFLVSTLDFDFLKLDRVYPLFQTFAVANSSTLYSYLEFGCLICSTLHRPKHCTDQQVLGFVNSFDFELTHQELAVDLLVLPIDVEVLEQIFPFHFFDLDVMLQLHFVILVVDYSKLLCLHFDLEKQQTWLLSLVIVVLDWRFDFAY